MVEGRISPRLSTSLPVLLQFPESDVPEGWGRILDLSMSGVRVETRWNLKIGQVVYITFVPQSEMRLDNLRARVVRFTWEDGYFVGGLVFDESVDQAYLREVLMYLVSR
ncbi:MAG TPA: PilZ domain-containing protein [Elusimicrobiota bacterium]|nr:PilZ domain-containing protein [Elusimicrobiota bacterium]